MRVLLFTGKGGVGKTSIAAATAVRAARQGARTLVLSTDPAHSLSDALDVELGGEPGRVATNLEGQQVDARARLETHWRRVQEYVISLLSHGGVDELEAEELSVLPGLEEVFGLVDVRDHVAAGRHDLLVVDCAPTAETLRLLSLPPALGWYLQRLSPLARRWHNVIQPLLGDRAAVPAPRPDVLSAVEALHHTLDGVRDVLVDAHTTSLRLVVTPERVVMAEARRLMGQLALFGYNVDAAVVNRVLPDEVDHPFFTAAKRRQQDLLGELEDGFAGAPVLNAPLRAAEPVGADALAELADALYGERDERAVLHHGEPLRIEPAGQGWTLRLRLPFVEREELDVLRRGEELLVRVGSQTRSLMLPAALRRGEIAEATLCDGELVVRLMAPEPGEATDPSSWAGSPAAASASSTGDVAPGPTHTGGHVS
jgi:arsenite-transporting ATPase